MAIRAPFGGKTNEFSRFDLEAAAGLVSRADGNISPSLKVGFNLDVGTTFEAIHSLGGLINFPQAAEPVRIKSGGDAADDAAGLGAQSILVSGIDSDLNAAEELIVTNGVLSSAQTTKLFWRVFNAEVIDTGAFDVPNTGQIVIENTISLQELVDVPVGAGQARTSLISTARNRPLVITALTLEVESGKIVEFNVCARQRFNEAGPPFAARRSILAPVKAGEGVWPIPIDSPLFIPELSDVWMEAVVPSTSAQAGSLMSCYTVPMS